MSKILSVLSCCLIFNSVNGFITPRILQAGAAVRPSSILSAEKSNVGEDDFISDFCIGTNTFWKGLVMKPVRDLVDVRSATITPDSPIIDKLTSPPEIPGISRPVWLSVLGSVPTGLIWYGYYKFSVEEELFQYELQVAADRESQWMWGLWYSVKINLAPPIHTAIAIAIVTYCGC